MFQNIDSVAVTSHAQTSTGMETPLSECHKYSGDCVYWFRNFDLGMLLFTNAIHSSMAFFVSNKILLYFVLMFLSNYTKFGKEKTWDVDNRIIGNRGWLTPIQSPVSWGYAHQVG